MKNKYLPYSISDIDILMKEPWEISDQPFMLHAAFALSSLYDICTPDSDDEEEPFSPDDLWGSTVPKKILDRLVLDLETDFNDAASKYKPVKIWGKTYSIRKVNSYDRSRLHLIFDFPLKDEEYVVTKDGVIDLRGVASTELSTYEVSKEQAKANRTYLRQIIMLAENDEENGWDQLTDMEIILYCWALFYNKHQFNNFLQFKNEYKDYLYVEDSDILKCLNEKSTLRKQPIGMYAFSRDKVMQWNKDNGQPSVADQISANEAEEYWYSTALKKTFKPIDL